MDELPPWLVLMSENQVLRDVLHELAANPQFLETVGSALAGDSPFPVWVGGMDFLERMNSTRPRKDRVQPGKELGAITMFNRSADGTAGGAGVVVDIDRLHKLARQDSALAKQYVRDALLHEFGHVLPVARSRSLSDRTFDPKPGDPNAAQHPAIQSENALRQLLGLKPKRHYGLLDPSLR